MRSSVLALSFMAFIVPCTVSAAPAGAPCDLLDREAIAALKLDGAAQSSEHKQVLVAKHLPKQDIKTCTVPSLDPSAFALMITSVKAPANAAQAKPSCSLQPLQKMAISTCSATTRNESVTFVRMSVAAAGPAIKAALSSQVERLLK